MNILQDGQTLRTNADGSRVLIGRDGKVIEVVEDGTRVRVPLYMMDSAKKDDKTPTFDASAHRPHQLVRAAADAAVPMMGALTAEQQAQFDEAYAKRKKRLERRYKHAASGVVG